MDLLHPNGIDALDGAPLVPPLTLADAAALARASLRRPPGKPPRVTRSLAFGTDPTSLADVGWALVAPQSTLPAIQKALTPLLDHRRSQAGPHLFKILDVRPGEKPRDWLARHGAGHDVEPEQVPYYLLLVADPTEISYEFQYALSVTRCVGRLPPDLVALPTYATSVVAAEQSPPRRARRLACWAPRHDPSTSLSADHLVAPLLARTPAHPAHVAEQATRQHLLDLLHGRGPERPALLLTAAHGLGFPLDHPRQHADQGALLCQEWPGHGAPDRTTHIVAADHIGDDADLHGLVAFLFACFGAGTPATDEFLRTANAAPRKLAHKPFLSALPTRLLTHPAGTALAVVGHVERAWGCSFFTKNIGSQLLPFHNFIAKALSGIPIGHALRDFPERQAAHADHLLEQLRDPTTPPQTLVLDWIQRNDARNYILLGDPAVRLAT